MATGKEDEKKQKMTTEQENQAATADKLSMGNPSPYLPPFQQPLQQEPTPQRERVEQFIHQNPEVIVLQQQPYQPQIAGFGDISSGYGYNQPMPQQMPLDQMTSTQSTVIVTQPQHAPVMVVNEAPYSYMLFAILSCLFCLPLGIGAIVAASDSQSEAAEMKYDEARRSARTTKSLATTAIVCGMVITVLIMTLINTAFKQNNY